MTTLRRITIADAGKLLGVSRKSLESMLGRDLFTVQKDGTGKTSRRFLFSDEVETYIEANSGGDGEAGSRAVLALRIEKRRKRKR